MERPAAFFRHKRPRSKSTRTRTTGDAPAPAPLHCHVVDDHCDALRHIHAAIRRGDLPFTGLRMLHFDAHPDLMVTPDMPAATCFRPHDLYDTLDTTEGGIAEWILPLVYQGHLSRLWWVRPPWARQFVDGEHSFCVGEVDTTGRLRVSSTAPYFVDDRLHCPEANMKGSKPLHLRVSLAAETGTNGAPATAGSRTSEEAATTLLPQRVEAGSVVVNSAPSERLQIATSRAGGTAAQEKRGASATMNGEGIMAEGEVTGGAKEPTNGTPTATQPHDVAEISNEATPWVLDICLDYFTTENPFMAELEACMGKEDAALIQAFYERPRFRGAATALPHGVQVEHERIFKSEIDRLLSKSTGEVDGHEKQTAVATEGVRGATKKEGSHSTTSSSDDVATGKALQSPSEENNKGNNNNNNNGTHASDSNSKASCHPGKVGRGTAVPEEGEEEKGRKTKKMDDGLQRLEQLFFPTEEDRSLVRRFVSLVGRLRPKEREMVVWADHCACLPRYSATREEVSSSVRTAEGLLRSLMMSGRTEVADRGWSRRPGVVTVARSEGDGYVPSEMVAFVEGEVLAMLKRLFDGDGDEQKGEGGGDSGGGGGGGSGLLKVFYEEGLERT